MLSYPFPGEERLFFLPWADERVEQPGDGVGFFGAEDPFVHVPYVLNREKSMGICCLDMFSNPWYINPVDKGESNLDIPPRTGGIQGGNAVIF